MVAASSASTPDCSVQRKIATTDRLWTSKLQGTNDMSGWLVSLTYDANAGVPTLEALFATWSPDSDEALRQVAAFDPRGSQIRPRLVAELPDSLLRGLKLSPGQTGLLQADTTRP